MVSRRMSKELRIMKSTEHNVKSKQTQYSLRTQHSVQRMDHSLDIKQEDTRGIVFPVSALNKRMGDLPKRRLSMASFVLMEGSLTLTVDQ